MVKRSIEQNLRIKNFEARNGNYETNAVVKNQGTKQREQRTLGDCWQWKANGQCSKGDNCSFRHDINKRAKFDTAESFSELFHAAEWEKCVENQKSQRQESQWKNVSIALQGLPQRNLHQFILWKMASSRMLVLQVREWLQIWEKSALMRIARLKNSRAKGPKEWWQKCSGYVEKHEQHLHTTSVSSEQGDCWMVIWDDVQWLCWWSTRQLGCVFQDMEPPKSSSILRKSSNIRKPIRCVKFTKAVVRHADIRDQNPSLGMICPGEPHQRNPNAPKFEDRSQEETEWQERCAREAAWRLAKSVLKLKEKKSSILLTFGK